MHGWSAGSLTVVRLSDYRPTDNRNAGLTGLLVTQNDGYLGVARANLELALRWWAWSWAGSLNAAGKNPCGRRS
jgi:hypothetical protein